MIPLLLPDVSAPADKAAGVMATTEGETSAVSFGAVLAGLRSGEGKEEAEGEVTETPGPTVQEEGEETPVLLPELPEEEVTAPLAFAAAELPSGKATLQAPAALDAAAVIAPTPQPRGLLVSAGAEMPSTREMGEVTKPDAATPPRSAASPAQVLFTQRTSAAVPVAETPAHVKADPPVATPAPVAVNTGLPAAIKPPLDAVPAAAPALAKGLVIAQEATQQQRKGRPDTAQPAPVSPQVTPASQTDMPPPAVSLMQSHAALATRWAEAGKAESAESLSKIADVDLGLVTTGGDRPAQTSGASPVLTGTAPSDMARHAAQQIAMAITQTNGKVTEISLNPEELGRVRLSLAAGEGAITLAISADRPETADLLRRHIDTLAQEFRSLGYDNLTFSFGSGSDASGSAGSDNAGSETGAEAVPLTADAVAMPTPTKVITTGLDLRL